VSATTTQLCHDRTLRLSAMTLPCTRQSLLRRVTPNALRPRLTLSYSMRSMRLASARVPLHSNRHRHTRFADHICHGHAAVSAFRRRRHVHARSGTAYDAPLLRACPYSGHWGTEPSAASKRDRLAHSPALRHSPPPGRATEAHWTAHAASSALHKLGRADGRVRLTLPPHAFASSESAGRTPSPLRWSS
jgi:hypothetical protein